MKQFILIWFLFTCLELIKSQEQTLLFEDRFQGDKLDLTKWKHEVGHKAFASGKQMCYRPDNVAVNNGLKITAKPEEVECDKNGTILQFTSGRIKTLGTFNFTYIEVKAKLSNGKNLQPALWTKSPVGNKYEEIDLVELKGTESDKLVTSVHWGVMKPRNLNKINRRFETSDLSEQYHIYAVDRTDTDLIFYLDNSEYYRVPRNVNDTKIITMSPNFVISLSVGGNWFHYYNVTHEEAKQWRKPSLEVDYIRIYGYK